jgi:hypothetical protein
MLLEYFSIKKYVRLETKLKQHTHSAVLTLLYGGATGLTEALVKLKQESRKTEQSYAQCYCLFIGSVLLY